MTIRSTNTQIAYRYPIKLKKALQKIARAKKMSMTSLLVQLGEKCVKEWEEKNNVK